MIQKHAISGQPHRDKRKHEQEEWKEYNWKKKKKQEHDEDNNHYKIKENRYEVECEGIITIKQEENTKEEIIREITKSTLKREERTLLKELEKTEPLKCTRDKLLTLLPLITKNEDTETETESEKEEEKITCGNCKMTLKNKK